MNTPTSNLAGTGGTSTTMNVPVAIPSNYVIPGRGPISCLVPKTVVTMPR